MAKIKVVRETPKPVQLPVKEVVLTLNSKEASSLMAVLEFVGGSPFYSNRQYIDNIYLALKDNSITGDGEIQCKDGGLFFENNNKESK